MTFGDVYEKGCDFWLVMFMDRRYRFGDVKEFVYFSDVKELRRWQLVMSMNRGMFIDWWCSWIQNIVLVRLMNWPFFGDRWVAITLFGNVNESDCILLVMLMKLFLLVMLTNYVNDIWWCLWKGVWFLIGDVHG